MGFREVLFVAAILDYDRRRTNYEEFRERTEGNIRRWEENLSKNRDFQYRTEKNIERNRERLEKAQDALERRSSQQTLDWLKRQRTISETHRSEEARSAALAKVHDHESKIRDIERSISQFSSWIMKSQDDLNSARNKARELDDKISSARSKL
jgi:chromosome segregation ATPase